MSKSRGNVINPDELVEKYGADVVRCYLMFNFDWQKGGPWNENNIKGPQGWLYDVWAIAVAGAPDVAGDPARERDIKRKLHQTLAVVNRGLEEFSFNTAIAEQMKFKNALKTALREGKIGPQAWRQCDEYDDPSAGTLCAAFRRRIVGAAGLGLQCSYASLARIRRGIGA